MADLFNCNHLPLRLRILTDRVRHAEAAARIQDATALGLAERGVDGSEVEAAVAELTRSYAASLRALFESQPEVAGG